MMDIPRWVIYVGGWYLSGLVGGIFWPLYYRRNMMREDWVTVFKQLPLLALTGPLAIILGFPV